MAHVKDSLGRLTTAEPHEATFSTLFPNGAPTGATRIVQNTQTDTTKILSKDSLGRLKTDGLGR